MEVKTITNDQGVEEQVVEVNGEQIPLDQAEALLTAGKSFEDLRGKYPEIDFNELPKSFTEKSQELAKMKQDLEKKDDKGTITDEESKRLEQIDNFFNDPYVQKRLSAMQEEKEKQLKEDLEFQKIREGLEAEFDGSDGKPKFEYLKVLEYGKENGIFNLRKAYEAMHYDELVEWKLQKKLEKKFPGTFSEKRSGAGAKPPAADTPKTFKEAREAAEADLV